MNTSKRRHQFLVGAIALSLVAAACGSDDSGDSTTAAPETTAAAATTAAGTDTTAAGTDTTTGTETTAGSESTGAPAEEIDLESLSGELNGSGATFPKVFYDEAIAELAGIAPDLTIDYGGGGSGKGRTDLQEQVVDFAGTDCAGQGRGHRQVQGRRVRLRPDRDRADHRVVQPRRRRRAAADAGHDRQDLPARDHELERSGDRRRQPRRRRCPTRRSSSCTAPTARAPPRTSPSSSTPPSGRGRRAATWTLGTGSELEWPDGTQAGDGNGGVAQIDQPHRGRDRLRRPLRRRRPRPDLRHGAEQGRQVRRSRRSRRTTAAAEGATINDDLTFFARLGRRRRRLPDRRPDLDHRLHDPGRRRRRPPGAARLPDLPADRRPGARRRSSTTRRCPADLQAKALANVAKIGA